MNPADDVLGMHKGGPWELQEQLKAATADIHERDKREATLLRLLAINAYRCHAAMLARDDEAGRQEWKRTNQPRVGDLVVEWSTLRKWARYPDDTPIDHCAEIGTLLRVAEEPFHDTTEIVYYVKPLDGHRDEVRWTNASFIRVQERIWRQDD